MFKRIPLSIWLVILPLADLLGILPGIGMMQPHWLFVVALAGWLSLPYYFYSFITHSLPNDPGTLFVYQTTLNYPLAMLIFGICAYWTIRTTRSIREGAKVMAVAVCVSTMASIPSAIITYCMINEPHAFFPRLAFHRAFLRVCSSYPWLRLSQPVHFGPTWMVDGCRTNQTL